ncbi:4Fe-4S binding protein [Candidatus Hecatella orcuttiae]|uniref:4Fe-4S binding protein n=1 Tax=Candidatus Hecatella orcuttiae TaxID=1935119 RepID=UPI002867FC77|nr:4Fe-4S binding protein [Candidatus Hecatella orcuttiae]
MPRIQINLELCDGCGTCVYVCPASVLEPHGRKVKVANPEACLGIRAKNICAECMEKEESCLGCLACVKTCPTAAIEIFEA